MVERNVERKVGRKRKSAWGWIVGVILAIVIIWGLFMFLGDEDVGVDEPLGQSISAPAQSAGGSGAPSALAES